MDQVEKISHKCEPNRISPQPLRTTNIPSQCSGCLNNLERDRIISALDQNWHIDCFRCSVCDAQLSNWYFEKDGLLFCRDDYWQRFGDACQQCAAFISGPVMIAGDHKFHPECFCCAVCQQYIGDGDSYALVERSKLFCGNCYRQQVHSIEKASFAERAVDEQPTSLSEIIAPFTVPRTSRTVTTTHNISPKTLPHSIRLVEIPWTKGTKGAIRLSIDDGQNGMPPTVPTKCAGVRISELDMNNDLISLHIGDKILEVNGTPVIDESIENIDALIESSNDVLQLTIEHDPHRLTKSASDATICTIQPTISAEPPEIRVTRCTRDVCYNRSPSMHEPSSSSSTTALMAQNGRIFTKQFSETEAAMDSLANAQQYVSGTKTQQLCKSKNLNLNCAIRTNNLKNQKERCSSMSKLLDENHAPVVEFYDLSRTKSFRVDAPESTPRIFRANDLVMGELLGKGFFGQVFKVTHKQTKEVMVLKELYRVDEEAQRNFLKEVAVLRSLSHCNVLRFIGVLYRDKKLHLVTEFVPGGSLKELIHDSDLVLPWERRILFAKDIACGMAYLHSKNIIHRDLNSLNCLVREDKTVIVADFGLARIIKSSNSKNSGGMTVNGNGTVNRKYRQRRQRYTVVGNPYWMAPEMMKMMKYDEKVDIFSFGIVLCEIIGRVQADPDFLPRTSDFGLNQKVFRETFCIQCPEIFYKIAFLCCDLNPDARPSFEILDVWLESLARHLSTGRPLPGDLRCDIENFKETVAMEKLNSPPTSKKIDAKLSSPPLNKKSDFIVNNNSSAQCKSEAIIPAFLEDSGPQSIIVDRPMFDQKMPGLSNNCNKSTANGIKCAENSISFSIKDLCSPNAAAAAAAAAYNNNASNSNKFVDIEPTSNCKCSPINTNSSTEIGNDFMRKSSIESMSSPVIREIPTSPHLSKDFSPNGERLRNSIRARRQERLQKQRSLRNAGHLMTQQSNCSSDGGSESSMPSFQFDDIEAENMTSCNFGSSKSPFARINDIKSTMHRRKSKPYGDKGFIINVNDGLLTINDVKDLNNCYSDDFDSSCDTSLNYIDPDSIAISADLGNNSVDDIIGSSNSSRMGAYPVVLCDIDNPTNVAKCALDEVRESLNKCKSKLDSLEIETAQKSSRLGPSNPKVSLNDIPSPQSKVTEPQIDKIPTQSHANSSITPKSTNNNSLYSRLNPLSSPILNSRTGRNRSPDPSTLNKSIIKSDPDAPKKYSPKLSDSQKGIKSNTKNYCKSTISYLERISDGLNDVNKNRKTAIVHAAANAATTAVDHHKPNEGRKREKEFFSEKLINKLNTGSLPNRLYSADGPSTEVFAKKPPAPTSLKKRGDATKTIVVKANEKQKKITAQTSPSSRKFL